MKKRYRAVALALLLTMTVGMTAGCGASSSENAKKIIRIGHNQSTNHPTHIALLAFEEFIEEDYIRKGYQTIIKKKKTIKHI